MIGHNFEMRVGEMVFAGNSLPVPLFHARTVAAAVLSGKPCSSVCVNAEALATASPLQLRFPALDLRRDIFRRRRTDRSPLRKRTAHIENVRNIDLEQRRTLFQLGKGHLI